MLVQWRLRSRLILLLVLFALIPTFLGGVVTIFRNYQAVKQTAADSSRMAGQLVASQITQYVNISQNVIETLAASAVARSMDPTAIQELVVSAKQKNPQFEGIFANDTSGMQISNTTGKLNNRSDRQYFKEAIKGNTFCSDVYISGTTNAPCITIAIPIKNQAGAIIGILGADINLKTIENITGKAAIGKTGYIDVIDTQGTLIYHPDFTRVLKKESLSEIFYAKQIMNGNSGLVEAKSTRGDEALIVYTIVDKYKWGVITYQPLKEIYSTLLQGSLVIGLFLLCSMLLAVWTAFAVARGIVKPIQDVIIGAKRMSEGDFSGEAKRSTIPELNELAEAFSAMKDSLREIITHTVSTSEAVSSASEELAASASEISKATGEVAVSTQKVTGGTTEQVELAQRSVMLIEKTINNIGATTKAAHLVVEETQRSEQVSQAGAAQIAEAITGMSQIQRDVAAIAQRVYTLGEKSGQIGKIVDVITSIAGQTNLLALNAAIEAARAGEHGRGFAVVAEEVRKLAEQSEAAAKDIAQIISSIQQETTSAVVDMEKGSQEVTKGVAVVENSEAAFNEIHEAVKKIGREVANIVAFAEEQQANASKVEHAIKRIVASAEDNAANSSQVAAACEEQNASIQEIAAASAELAERAAGLQQIIVKFRL